MINRIALVVGYGVLITVAVALILLGANAIIEEVGTVMPRCPEDSVLVGVGQFERGYWDSYECGPAVDDYAP